MICRRVLPIIFLLLAFLLRVWGLDFGLPFEFHPDEHQYVNPALNWNLTGQFQTGTVNPPLFSLVLSAAFRGWLWPAPFTPTESWVTTTYFFGRLWSVIFGMLTVALVFAVGRRVKPAAVAFLAMVLMAGTFLPARESHFAVNDTAATFLALLAIYGSLGIFNYGRYSDYALAGIGTGFAVAAKLNMGLVVLPVLAAHMFAVPADNSSGWKVALSGRRGRRFLGAMGLALLIFLLTALPIFWELGRFLENVDKHLQFGSEGYKGLQMAPAAGWIYYLTVLGWGIGWLVLLAAVGGMGWALARWNRSAVIVAIFPVTLFFYMGAQEILFARFILPATPPLLVLAALGVVVLARSWPFFQHHRSWLWPVAILTLLSQPLIYLIWFNHLLTLPDTRQLASKWLLVEFSEETVLVKESYSVFPNQFFLNKDWGLKTIQIDERGPTRNDVDHYLAHKTNLIVLSNFIYARKRQQPDEEEARQQQLAALIDQAKLVKTFTPYRNEPNWFYLDEVYGPAGEVLQRTNPGPLIKIYRLPYEAQPHTMDIPPIPTPVQANFDNKMLLLGFDLPVRKAKPGGSFPVTLYWQAIDQMDETYVVFNRLLDDEQRRWGGYDRWPLETANTRLWHPGEVVIDSFNIPVGSDAPPGIYTIDLGLYDQADPAATPLTLLNSDGRPIDQTSVRLKPVKVGKFLPPTSLNSTPDMQHQLTVKLGDPPIIELLGYTLKPADQAIKLTLYWKSLDATPIDWSIFAHMRDSVNSMVAQMDGPAGEGQYPTSLWDPGEVIVDNLLLSTEKVAPGEYTLVIGLYDLTTGERLMASGNRNGEIQLEEISVVR